MSAKKVLVAEDSSVIQNLTKKILSAQNFEITAVKNGKQVLDKLAKDHYDIILMDINMPVMDGMECARQIRGLSEAQKANTPIIAITGNAMNYSLEDYQKVGINEFLQKPLDFDKLVELVIKHTS
jgi:two-component system, cell cycle response regulator DivK